MRSATIIFAAAIVGLLGAVGAAVPAVRKARQAPVVLPFDPQTLATQAMNDGAVLTTISNTVTQYTATIQSAQFDTIQMAAMQQQVTQFTTQVNSITVYWTTVTTTLQTVTDDDVMNTFFVQVYPLIISLRDQTETLDYTFGKFTMALELRISNLPVISPLVPDIFIFQVVVKNLSFTSLINSFMNVLFVIRAQDIGVSYNFTGTVPAFTTVDFDIYTGPNTILAVDVEAIAFFAMELTLFVVDASGFPTAVQLYLAEQPFGVQYCGFWVGAQPIKRAFIRVQNKGNRIAKNIFFFGVYA